MDNNKKKEDIKLPYPICEVEMDGKMALVSLYDDLPHFEYDMTIDKLKSSNNKLRVRVQELEQHARKIEKEYSQLKKTNGVLSKNMVSLYKTACGEIKRKDKMINELRKSCSKNKPLSESKMFSSSNLVSKKTQFNELPNDKQDKLETTCDEEKSKTVNQNESVNTTNIIVKPNNDIPKTVYYKRLCQKLTQQNQNILSANKSPMYLDTITSQKTQEEDVCLKNDENVLKEVENPVHCNDVSSDFDSTLIICEPDMPPSDSELSSTSVVQCKNVEKGKENISTKSCFFQQKPKKSKKKFVISPASIGVLNISNETSKCIEKLRNNKNLDFKVLQKINNSQETELNPIEDTQSMCIKEVDCGINRDINSKHAPRTDIVHKQNSFTHDKNNETLPVSNEIIHVPSNKKTAVTKKTSVTKKAAVTKKKNTIVKKSQKVTGLSFLDDSSKISPKNATNSILNMEHKLSSLSLEKDGQLKTMLNDVVESSSKTTAIKTNRIISSKNIETETNYPVKVTTVKKSSPVISSGPSDSNDLNTPEKYINCSSNNNAEESSQTKEQNNQLKCMLNDNVESSSKNMPIPTYLTNKISTQSQNTETKKNYSVKVTTVKKSPVISLGTSDGNDLNKSTKYINYSFNNNVEKSSPTKEQNNQQKCMLIDNISPKITDETNFSNKIGTPSKSIETSKNDHVKVITVKKSSRGIFLGLSGDNGCNKSAKYVNCSIISNESSKYIDKNNQLKFTVNDNNRSSPKNRGFETNIIHKINMSPTNIGTGKIDPVKVTTIKKSSRGISLGLSSGNDCKTSTKYVNCSTVSNEKESSKYIEKNNQQKCIVNDIDRSSLKNKGYETNIGTGKIDPVKVIAVRKSSRGISLGLSGDNDCNTSTKYVNCSTIINEKESSKYKEKNNQLEYTVNDNVKCSPKNKVNETNIMHKINTPPTNIETEKIDPVKVTTIKKSSRVISLGLSGDNNCNISTKYINCSSNNNNNESSQFKEKNNQLKCISNDTVKNSSKNIAHETNLINKISTPSKSIVAGNNDTFKVTTIKKSSRVISLGLSSDNNCNTSTMYVHCSSDNNKKDSSHYKEKNNKLKCVLNDTVESSPKNRSDTIILTNKMCTPYKSIETRKSDSFIVTTVRKSPQSVCLSRSDDQGPNVAFMHVKCVSLNSCENKPSYTPKPTNCQLKCNANNIVNSSCNLAVETSLTNKINNNIEVNHVPTRKSTENNFIKVTSVKKSSRVVPLSSSVDNSFNTLTEYVKCSPKDSEKESSSRPKEKNNQLGLRLNDVKSSSINISVGTNIVTPTTHYEVDQVPIIKKIRVTPRNNFHTETEVNKSSDSSVDCEPNKTPKRIQCLPKVDCGKTKILSSSDDLENKSVCSSLSQDENNQEFKKGRRVKLITIKDHYSEPLPSFNGAKKTEIDVSKNSVHIEKEVESSSRFYLPHAKRRRLSNYGKSEP